VKVLLVDDDVELLDVTAYALQRGGHKVVVASDGPQAVRCWKAEQPDVIVLDIGLPQMDGLEVCRRIREQSTTPVIFLTGFTDEDHMVQGFRIGGDDYVTKPFSPRVLAARIQAVTGRNGDHTIPTVNREFTIGSLSIDIDSHEVRSPEGTVRLTPLEFRLVHLLAMNMGRVVSNDRLVDYVWSFNGGETALLKTHISHIRSKLQLARFANGDIHSIPGVGYRLVTEQHEALAS